MAAFLTRLSVDLISEGDNLWILDKDLDFLSDLVGPVKVLKNFITDFASVPRIPFVYLATGDIAREAAVVHDWLYSQADHPREICDKVFLEAMEVTGIPSWKRKAMYWAVRMFAGRHYKNR